MAIGQSIGQYDANRRNLIHRPTTHIIVMSFYKEKKKETMTKTKTMTMTVTMKKTSMTLTATTATPLISLFYHWAMYSPNSSLIFGKHSLYGNIHRLINHNIQMRTHKNISFFFCFQKNL